MPQAILPVESATPPSLTPSWVARVRLGIGLLQGGALYFLYHAASSQTWPAVDSQLFGPLLLVSFFIPVLMMSGLGHLANKAWWRWMLVATLVVASLAYYDTWRIVGAPAADYGPGVPKAAYPSHLLWLFGAGGFYIAHALVLASATDQRRIASYPSYFDSAWKLLIQIQFSVLFVGAFWAVLGLGAALFKLIQLTFFMDLLKEPWFAIPVTVFAFACALHLTDMRPAIVHGIRNLLLVLLSWIMPVAVLIIGGFLLSLPFTGMAPLWATKHAGALLLSASALLVILINTAFQNGAVANQVAPVLRISARLACVLLLPLVGIASYALGLRVGDYGWTTDRIIAACCLLVASCYALGYAWAASRRSGWLDAVASVNIATAFVILAVLLALFSPVLDPARISVADQLARLEGGQQTAAKFDFDYLKFDGKRYGAEALERLKTSAQGKDSALIQIRAAQSLAKQSARERTEVRPTFADLRANLKVWPKDKQLPESFVTQDWTKEANPWRLPTCFRKRTVLCDVYVIESEADNKASLLVVGQNSDSGPALFAQTPDNRWHLTAVLPHDFARCAPFREKLQAGEFSLVPPTQKDLQIADRRVRFTPVDDPGANCPNTKK
jgi:hypothetical protein